MVVQNSAALGSINQNSLPARSVDGAVASKNRGSTARKTADTAGIHKRAADTAAAADLDGILQSLRRLGGIISAADARAPEEIVIRRAVVHGRALLSMSPRGVVGDLVAGTTCKSRGAAVQRDLVDVSPEGAKRQVVG